MCTEENRSFHSLQYSFYGMWTDHTPYSHLHTHSTILIPSITCDSHPNASHRFQDRIHTRLASRNTNYPNRGYFCHPVLGRITANPIQNERYRKENCGHADAAALRGGGLYRSCPDSRWLHFSRNDRRGGGQLEFEHEDRDYEGKGEHRRNPIQNAVYSWCANRVYRSSRNVLVWTETALMCRFKHSPLFQRVLDFKKGDTAPKVQLDMNLRMGARRCRFVVVVFIVESAFQ